MPARSTNIFEYCDTVRQQFQSFSLGRENWASDIKAYIEALRAREEWAPPALLQINPSYDTTCTVADLVENGDLHQDWEKLVEKFPHPLYRHQREAIDTAKRGENYVITAGTGSGKSLGYIIPIIDRILTARRKNPDGKGIKAIICYPMNALVNSQMKALDDYRLEGCDIRYERYTGQDDRAHRMIVQGNPPDILLTNFMMLEYMLTRNKEDEKPILNALGTCDCLVMDELHTYRGRQGADIAMLIRRLRLFLGKGFLCIGTSATMTSDEGDDSKSNELVAKFATRLFGSPTHEKNIITETLIRKTQTDKDLAAIKPDLRGEIEAGANRLLESEGSFKRSAAAIWCEFQFGIEFRDQMLARKQPQSIQEAAKQLAEDSGLPSGQCESFLREFLTQTADREYFAMRLHQFFSGPGQFLCTLKDENGRRDFSIHGEKDSAAGHPFYATHFCRNCSHEFHPVWMKEDVFYYRGIDDIGNEKDNQGLNFGFITPVVKGMKWPGEDGSGDSNLPDEWLEEDRHGNIIVRSTKKNFLPKLININTSGQFQLSAEADAAYILLPGKFRFCPKCGDTHIAAGRDANRLKSLNAEGRCSATTILLLSLLRNEPRFRQNSHAKTLAFSDNRQDAALQAGYFNDFIFNLKLRAGLLKALQVGGGLRHDEIAGKVMAALGFTEEEVRNNPDRRREFLQNPDNTNMDNLQRMREILRDIIGYRLMFDLRRGWRHNNPNLQRLGLLEMGFDQVERLKDIANWHEPPNFVRELSPARRQKLAETMLEHMLEEQCLNSRYLSEEAKESISNRARDNLTPEWYDKTEHDSWETARMLNTGRPQKKRGRSFARSGPTSRLGKKIRPIRSWQVQQTGGMLPSVDYEQVLNSILATLRNANLVIEKKLAADSTGWQLNCDCLIWTIQEGDENYYTQLYSSIKIMLSDEVARGELANLNAHEHTAQVNARMREEYEEHFRGDRAPPLPVLVCSPTMELGIDISDLNTVYLRNVPPTPANYVQRSGRAGRAGHAALVVAYCAAQSPHDQYFFQRQRDMVAGKIHAPTLELANQDLLVSHFNAIWLQKTGVAFPNPVAGIIDYKNDLQRLPIKAEYQAQLQDDAVKQEAQKDITRLIADLQAAGLIPAHAKHWLTPNYQPPDMYRELETALDRWRSLYRAVRQQIENMSRIMNDPTVSQAERDRAKGLHQSAYYQEKTLLQEEWEDFYSYRFLASQGFLPGYNFPRLPLVAFLPIRGRPMDQLSRPRFLALSEFGPRSLIYHEGNRYCVSRATLRASDDSSGSASLLTKEMRVCKNCGYGYLSGTIPPDCCNCCEKPLADADTVPALYEVQDFTAHRIDRINAGEEERQRQGYKLQTVYCFNDAAENRISSETAIADNKLLLDYGQAATVWRINLGWRRQQQNGLGFYINPVTGEWKKSEEEGEDPNEYSERIVPYVKDYRNILIMRWGQPLSPATATTLRHALKLGMTEIFQIEENELLVEPLPNRQECNAFLYYEAVEGGAGVLTRLTTEPKLLAKIAETALRMMHYDLPPLDARLSVSELRQCDEKICKSGCYRCLLSYYNQLDQEHIDRQDEPALSILLALRHAEVNLFPPSPVATGDPALPPPPDKPDPWLAAAAHAGWCKPDVARRSLLNGIVADHYYNDLQAAIFIGDSLNAEHKAALEDAGVFCISFPVEADKWQAVFDRPALKRMFT